MKAVTRALPGPPDLLSEAGEAGWLFRSEDRGLAARGVALRVELADGLAGAEGAVAAALAGFDTDDPIGRPGTGPVAIGALPFDPAEPASLVVPRVVVGFDTDGAWETVVGDEAPPPAAGPEGAPPDAFRLVPTMPHAEWKELVAGAVEEIAEGRFDKVVLARRVDVEANRPFVVCDVLERLVSLYPACTVFSAEGFIGASPELLVRRRGRLVESHPLAGTVARSGDEHGDEVLVAALMASPKARLEHRLVVEAIGSALASVCEEVHVPDRPSVLGLRNVSHLASHIEGRLAAGAPSALGLAALLHPTPAVCGSPQGPAFEYLRKVEGFERGRYAGPVGWVDTRGDGAWMLGIRSALVSGRRASIYAGNGIVAGSDPAEELAETQLKLQALLAALVRP